MSLPVLPAAQAITPSQLSEYGAQLVAWAETVDDVAVVREAANRWSAITEYVRKTSRDGLADAMAALRRLEVRVGELLGPPMPRRETGALRGTRGVHLDEHLDPTRRSDFRQMAAHSDVVEQVIAESTDENPPSRKRVMAAIKEKVGVTPTKKLDTTTDAVRRRLDYLRHLAGTGHTSTQIADRIGISVQRVRELARREGIEIPADRVTSSYSRRLDPEKVIENTIEALEGLALGLSFIEADIPALDAGKRLQWIERLREPLSAINRLQKGLRG